MYLGMLGEKQDNVDREAVDFLTRDMQKKKKEQLLVISQFQASFKRRPEQSATIICFTAPHSRSFLIKHIIFTPKLISQGVAASPELSANTSSCTSHCLISQPTNSASVSLMD